MAMADGSSSEELNLGKPLAALKPLEELTDADIRQLTREDCRRYLKERGMRRPSWNKAQAIQQVLSLRSLMCSSFSSGKGCSKADAAAANATVPQTKQFLDKVFQPKNTPDPPLRMQHSFLPEVASTFPLSSRPVQATLQKPHRGQLTIFYSGVVNVYEDVPIEKAQAIMLLAASKTFQVPATNPSLNLISTPQAQTPAAVNHHVYAPPFLPPAEPNAATATAATSASLNNTQHEESTDSGLPQARTVSLQRFLAKRRERISANPSFYRRCDKQQQHQQQCNKRSKTSSSPPPPPLPPVPPTRTASPFSSRLPSCSNHHINSNPHNIINNINSSINDFSSATASSDNTTTSNLQKMVDKSAAFLHIRRNLLGEPCKDRYTVNQADIKGPFPMK